MSAKIISLPVFPGVPTGNEIFEVSNAGITSYQIAMAILTAARQITNVSSGGTVNVGNTQFGDIVVTTTSAVTVNFPSALLRSGVSISVIAAVTGTPNITLAPFAGQTFLGSLSSLTITNPYGSYTLWPNAASLTGDWYQK
jgi:hypothetical protein